MLLRLITLSFLAGVALASCDPAVGVAISNKTNADKKIRVHYPKGVLLPDGRQYSYDSIWTYPDNNRYGLYHMLPTTLSDTSARVYEFVLKAGYTAEIESMHFGTRPNYGKTIIIDNTDTIQLKRHGKDFCKTPFSAIGGMWTHVIRDK